MKKATEKTLIAFMSTDEITAGESMELYELSCDVVVNDNRTVSIYQ